jgi:2-dehydropantoate 2-reductase
VTRIAIIGAGAIGSSLGGLLRRAGHDVVLIGRAEHVRAIRSAGLRVDGVMGAFTVEVAAAEVLTSRPDLAFLCVKTQDVLAAIQASRDLLAGATVITFQNGVRSDDIVASVIPEGRIVSAVVSFHASFLAAGAVTVLYRGPLLIGRPFGANDATVEAIAGILGDAFPTEVTGNIRGAHWLKLIVNLNNALPALTKLPLRDVFRNPFLRRLAVLAMREGLDVAGRAGIRLSSLPDMPARLATAMRLLPVPLAGLIAARKIGRMEARWPLIGSTLQSLIRHEPTEIDYLNGEVVRVGREVGVPTPVNAAIVRLVHGIEATGRFLSPAELPALLDRPAA